MLKKLLSIMSKAQIHSFTDDELVAERKKQLRILTIIIVVAFIVIELALYYNYSIIWQLSFIITLMIAMPRMITASRLSNEHFKRKKSN